jgi:oligopeptide transport system substrate-binding protein
MPVHTPGLALPLSQWASRFREQPPHVFVSLWVADDPDPDYFLRVGFRQDWTGLSNEAYTRLLEEARHTRDQARRIELYRQADRILIEGAVVVPIEYAGCWWLMKPWLTRFPSAIAQRFMF